MAILVVSFVLLLAIGVPIALVLGGSSLAYLWWTDAAPLSVVPQRIFAGLDQFVLMSVPFFILAGYLMNAAQLTDRLIELANHLVGRWRAGLAQVTVLTCMFFGGLTGAAAAEAAAVGAIMIPAMERQGYRRDFACALVIAASLCGPLIPPSIPMLVYGISSGASIGALFLAGATPGIAVGATLMLMNRIVLRRMPIAVDTGPRLLSVAGLRGFAVSCRLALVALMMPLIILGGIIGGIVTPTESSVIAVLYAVAVGLLMRTLRLPVLWNLLAKTTIISAAIMFIIGTAGLLGWVLTYEQVPQLVTQSFVGVGSRAGFILFVVVLLLVVGLFLETSGAIIILTPILLPTATALGIDPVHFGVVIVFGLVIGLLTPPVGLCLFVGCSIAELPLHVLSRAVLPQVAVLIVLYLVFAFWPEASLWLPHLFFK